MGVVKPAANPAAAGLRSSDDGDQDWWAARRLIGPLGPAPMCTVGADNQGLNHRQGSGSPRSFLLGRRAKTGAKDI
jgi:hypothetical protein